MIFVTFIPVIAYNRENIYLALKLSYKIRFNQERQVMSVNNQIALLLINIYFNNLQED